MFPQSYTLILLSGVGGFAVVQLFRGGRAGGVVTSAVLLRLLVMGRLLVMMGRAVVRHRVRRGGGVGRGLGKSRQSRTNKHQRQGGSSESLHLDLSFNFVGWRALPEMDRVAPEYR